MSTTLSFTAVANEDSLAEGSTYNNLIADLGFRPDVDGFSFSNFGTEKHYFGITPEDLRRMVGDQVCACQPKGRCILTPTWTYWAEMVNDDMDMGHCEGMAVLSLLIFEGLAKTSDFGAERTYDLKIPGNGALQEEIGYWWATQYTEPTISSKITGKPSEILDLLTKSIRDVNKTNKYTLAIFKRDGSDGHAITPFAVRDSGSGIFDILVYDNNHPGKTRILEINRNNESWLYQGSSNPNDQEGLYEGDAKSKNLELYPLSARLLKQNCSSCVKDVCTIRADGDVNLLIRDEKGRELGYVDGVIVNEIPGATFIPPMADGENQTSPYYIVPLLERLNIELEAKNSTKQVQANLTILAPEYAYIVENMSLLPGQTDTIFLQPQQALRNQAPFTGVYYTLNGQESPIVTMGSLENDTVYYFSEACHDLSEGSTLETDLSKINETFGFFYNSSTKEGVFDVGINRQTESKDETFGHNDLVIPAGCGAMLQYGNWTGNSTPMPMTLICGNKEETINLTDMTDQMPK